MKHFTTLCLFLFASILTQAQYCIPNPGTDGCIDGDMIDDFVIYGENGTFIINNGTGCSLNAYEDLTSLSVSLAQGTGYIATVSTQFFPDDNLAIWIDFNNDDVFDASELIGVQSNIAVSGSPVPLVIPSGSPLGPHRMRVSLRYDIPAVDIDPCNVGINASDFGEAHDYTVNIVPTPTCPQPGNLTLVSSTQNSASFSWTGSASQYGIEYGAPGFIPGTGTYATSLTNSITINGLNAGTSYSAYVRAICSSSDSSSIAISNFSTLCGTVNVPYLENFDGVNIPDIPNCMTVQDANSDLTTWTTQNFLFSSAPNALFYLSDFSQNANDWIFSPGINMVAGNTYVISFAYITEGSAPESLEVKAGTAAAAGSMVGSAYFSSTTLQNTNFVTTAFNYVASVTGPTYFGWHVFSNLNSMGIGLDDISITTTTPCDTSLSLTASSVTAVSATLNWSAVTGATGYQYVLDQNAGNPSGPGTPTTLTSYPATGLLPNTTYYFHVRTACGSAFSAWKTISFTTAPVSVVTVDGSNTSISVYPNPVGNRAIIECFEPGTHARLQMTDISGRVLHTIELKEKRTEIDMSKFAPGVYMIRYSDDNSGQVIKLVKQ